MAGGRKGLQNFEWKNIGGEIMTTKEFRDYVVECLGCFENITCRAMMGEYLLYKDGLLFGGIYDGRVLVKIVPQNEEFNMKEQIPYNGAKPMYYLENLDNQDLVKEVVEATCKGLSLKGAKQK